LTSEKEFIINKTYFKNDFYSNHNSEKRAWFFKTFLQQRHEMQNCFYDFITLHKVQILFFNWFELYYASAHHITYPFASTKHACPITSRNKTSVWELASGPSIESDHLPLRNLKVPHKDQIVEATPYKIPSEDVTMNTKHIIQQNNLTNTNLNTISKQPTKIEKKIQKTIINPDETTKSTDLRLNNNNNNNNNNNYYYYCFKFYYSNQIYGFCSIVIVFFSNLLKTIRTLIRQV
jgi:hypothetical protein